MKRPRSAVAPWLTIAAISVSPATSISSFRLDEADNNSSSKLSLLRPSTRAAQPKEHVSFSLDTPSITKTSLSDRFKSLPVSQDSEAVNDFKKRLLEQEQAELEASLMSNTASSAQNNETFLWKTAAAALFLIAASNMIATGTATAFLSELSKTSMSILSVLWIPVLWINPSSSPTRIVQDMLNYVQLFGNLQTISYIKEKALPFTVSTLKKMIVAELWTVFWAETFKQVGRVVQSARGDLQLRKGDQDESSLISIPRWLANGMVFFEKSIRKGMRNLVKGSLQKYLQASVTAVSSFVFVSLNEFLFGGQASSESSVLDDVVVVVDTE